METKAKKLNCLLSYWGLNRFSLGQISELLRLTKESYCNVKLKCPDTGQHTVHVRTCISIAPITHSWKETKPIPTRFTYRILSTVQCTLKFVKSSWKFLHELMTNDKLQHIKRWTHCFVCLSSSVHLKSFLKFLTLYLMYISTIQGFWQVAEEKVKFYGIFRDKFAEKLANFVVISLEFSGQTSPKSN